MMAIHAWQVGSYIVFANGRHCTHKQNEKTTQVTSHGVHSPYLPSMKTEYSMPAKITREMAYIDSMMKTYTKTRLAYVKAP